MKNETLNQEQQVRVLSPGMMVAKRFFRNRLAIIGLVIIVGMFLFAFLGGAIMPYEESQVFFTTEVMKKDYAGATIIKDYHIYADEEVTLPSDIYSKVIRSAATGECIFETRDASEYGLGKYEDKTFGLFTIEGDADASVLTSQAWTDAKNTGSNVFELDGNTYLVDTKTQKVYSSTNVGVVCQLSFTGYSKDVVLDYEFYKNVILAKKDNLKEFDVNGVSYQMHEDESGAVNVLTDDGTEYAYVSNMNINSVTDGVFLTPAYKMELQEAINDGKDSFDFTAEDGKTETYLIENKNGQYTIKRYQETRVIDIYAKPSSEHLLGTDANGMDILARLMYGGRISLLIGFIVVFIEVFIGVIVGGIAGFFGGWVDNILMRFVDIVYCIPSMPLYLILGSVMDYYDVSSTGRIYLLCVIMAIIGWVGIARIVRGQILSLREQEFMIAAEATGISIPRRIFKHLVPNVIPQLIVFASMGLGDIILSEAALSFLGLGVKYPAASWGSIINAVNDSYVMTNYLFVWVPAGALILLTVLAFNFIGDGLRDAFDPKMKR